MITGQAPPGVIDFSKGDFQSTYDRVYGAGAYAAQVAKFVAMKAAGQLGEYESQYGAFPSDPAAQAEWFRAAQKGGLDTANEQAKAAGERDDMYGTLFATLPMAAMTGAWAAGLGEAAGGATAGFSGGGALDTAIAGAGDAGAAAGVIETGGGAVGNEVAGAYTYDAATGQMVPAPQGPPGGPTGGSGGFQYSGEGTSTLAQAVANAGNQGLTGSTPIPGPGGLDPNATYWTNTAKTGGLLSGLNEPDSGLFGLTAGQTLGAASALGSLVQGGLGLYGSSLQADAAKNATAAQLQMFNTLNTQQAPYREAGYKALGTLTSPESGAYFNKQFGPADLQAGLAPGYEFMRDQGLRATKNAFNAQTGLISGNTAKGVADYATNYALNAGYQPSFNNFESQRTNIFNRLSAIAGLGQTANAQSVSAGTGLGPSIGTSIQNYGTALGGGFVGAGNAVAGGINNAASWYALPQILAMGRG